MLGVLIGALLSGATGLTVWWFSGPTGAARDLVGVWERDHGNGADIGKPHSTERYYFYRNGSLREVLTVGGMVVTCEGTWSVIELNSGGHLVVIHRARSSVRDEKGKVTEAVENRSFEWGVDELKPDRVKGYLVGAGGARMPFAFKRVEE